MLFYISALPVPRHPLIKKSTATLSLRAVRVCCRAQASKSSFWSTSDFYGLDLSCLHDECVSDHYAQPIVGYFDPAILLSPDVLTHTINFGSDTVADLAEINVPLHFTINKTGV